MDLQTVQQIGGALLALFGAHFRHIFQQLTLYFLNHIHHALDDLTGQVLEILRHHDFKQLLVGK